MSGGVRGRLHPYVGDDAKQMRAAYDSVQGGSWREVHHPAQAPFAFGQARRLRRE